MRQQSMTVCPRSSGASLHVRDVFADQSDPTTRRVQDAAMKQSVSQMRVKDSAIQYRKASMRGQDLGIHQDAAPTRVRDVVIQRNAVARQPLVQDLASASSVYLRMFHYL